jgi:predicted MPP superfamily phosphohydrolase
MKKIIAFLTFSLIIITVSAQKNFSFVFLPDLHLQPDSVIIASFERLTKQVNKLHPDFVLTGGDMIYTAKNVNDKKAEVLFDLMDKEFRRFKMPVFMTMGNHEQVGITQESGIDKTNPNWGKKMYEKRYLKRYYTFNYGDWKFFVLDGIKILEKEKDYTQGVDSIQIKWIRNELQSTNKNTPIVVSIHTPLINPHALTSSQSSDMSANSEAVLNLFKGYNLRIVLEGHTHIYMNLYLQGIYYVSGGSTSYGTENFDDGFVMIKVRNNTENLKFIKTERAIPKNQ